jgi:hypothetical protein
MQSVEHQGKDVERLGGVKGHEWHPCDVQCDVALMEDARSSVEVAEGATSAGYVNGPMTCGDDSVGWR